MAVDPLSRIAFILRAIEHARLHTSALPIEDFSRNQTSVEAVLFDLAVIGKAARLLPDEFTSAHSSIPWRTLAGLWDVVVNHCMNFEINPETVWNTVEHELPPLIPHLQGIITDRTTEPTMESDGSVTH